MKNQRVRVGEKQITSTFEEIKKQTDKKSTINKHYKQIQFCDLNRVVTTKRSVNGTETEKAGKKKRIIVSRRTEVKPKEIEIKPKKKRKNLIYMQQFSQNKGVQQTDIENCIDTEQAVEIYIKEEPDTSDLVDSKVDILDFDLSNNLNPICQHQSRRKQILQVKAVPEDYENDF